MWIDRNELLHEMRFHSVQRPHTHTSLLCRAIGVENFTKIVQKNQESNYKKWAVFNHKQKCVQQIFHNSEK